MWKAIWFEYDFQNFLPSTSTSTSKEKYENGKSNELKRTVQLPCDKEADPDGDLMFLHCTRAGWLAESIWFTSIMMNCGLNRQQVKGERMSSWFTSYHPRELNISTSYLRTGNLWFDTNFILIECVIIFFSNMLSFS